MTTLYIFAGLPGSGKTTLAQGLASHVGAVHLRIDTIEQALRDLCDVEVVGEGYQLAYRVAADNLRVGTSVVADCCNPWELTRREWEDVARALDVDFVNVEVVCSDKAEHRRRVETRANSIPNLELPAWSQVEARDYHSWTVPRVVVDTAGCTVEESFSRLCTSLGVGATSR